MTVLLGAKPATGWAIGCSATCSKPNVKETYEAFGWRFRVGADELSNHDMPFCFRGGGRAFVMAPECYSHSRVPEAMNGVREQTQEARGCLCRFLVATQQAESTGPEDRTRFHRVPGVG